MFSYIGKVQRDPFYQSTYKYLGKNSLAHAGFLYDKNNSEFSLTELEFKKDNSYQLDVSKISRQIENLSESQNNKLYVLLVTGSFNPAHAGHIEMMDKAYQLAIDKGLIVVGGYFSPSHDEYVFSKDSRYLVPARQRSDILNKMIKNSSLYCVSEWESTHDYSINFTDVITYHKTALNCQLKNIQKNNSINIHQQIEIIYVFGSDNIYFINAFIEQGYSICVPRNNDTVDANSVIHFEINKPHERIFIAQKGKDLCSSDIRNKLAKLSDKPHENFIDYLSAMEDV